MKRYFLLQCKRSFRLLPALLAVSLLLFGGLAATLHGMLQSSEDSAEQRKFQIAVVGDGSDALPLALSALQALDDTRFSVELTMMEEPEAAAALRRRDVSAYVVFPPGFLHSAVNGEIKTIRMVTDDAAGSLVELLKEEVAKAAATLVFESEKGSYGIERALRAEGAPALAPDALDRMSLEYVDLVLRRADLFELQTLGVGDRLALPDYYFCSFAVFLTLLLCLPFALRFVRPDHALFRILAAGGVTAGRQAVCEWAACTLAALPVVGGIAALACVAAGKSGAAFTVAENPVGLLCALTLVTATCTTLLLLVFSLANSLLGGVLLGFCGTLALCYVSGCFYPIYAFPAVVQRLVPALPTGLARALLAASATGESPLPSALGLLGYLFAALGLTVLARRKSLTRKAG